MLMLTILFGFLLQKIKSIPSQPQLLLIRAGQCIGDEESKNNLVRFSEMGIYRKDDKYYVTGFFYVKEDVPNGWSIRATKRKCVDIRNVDSCDFLRTFVVVTFACGGDEEGDHAAVQDIFNHTVPRITCPVKAGLYKLEEYCFKMRSSYVIASEVKISTSMFGYTLRMEGFDEDGERILCADLYLQLAYSRRTPQVVELDVNSAETTEDTSDATTIADDD